MAWAGGAFSRIGGTTHWVDDKNAAINIVASRHDTNDEDLAGGINACLTRDGTAKPTADFLPDVDNSRALGTTTTRWKSFNGLLTTTANAILGLGPVAAVAVDMTPDKSTFTGTLTGMAGATTGTVRWSRMGNLATIYISADIVGTSNSIAMTMTGVPAAIQPIIAQTIPCFGIEDSSGQAQMGLATVSATGAGTIVFQRVTAGTTVIASIFNNTGLKGLFAGWSITYAVA